MSNEKNKRKRSSKEKRVLIASVIVAGTIVAGSTFAWFTSSDTVTNKLSASGEYGVAIAESFEPTENWIPGQNIKKEAYAMNTGNVDAFVRMWLTGNLRVVTESNSGVGITDFKQYVAPNSQDATRIIDGDMSGHFSKMLSNDATYFRVLDENERKVMQTPYLAYAEGNYSYKDAKTNGVIDGTAFTDGSKVVSINSGEFTPKQTGLYIFRRVLNSDTTEYSGYYCSVDADNKITYYALVDKSTRSGTGQEYNENREIYIKNLTGTSGDSLVSAINQISVRTANRSILDNDDLSWKYTTPANAAASPFNSTNPYFVVSIKNPTDSSNQSSIKFNIELSNIGDGTEGGKWQPVSTGTGDDTSKYTFYYTDDVQSGGVTKELIKNVQLDTGLKEGAYISFDFDLDVNLDSIQIFKDDANVEGTTNVIPAAGWATTNANVTAAKIADATDVTHAADGKEISTIKWTAATNNG